MSEKEKKCVRGCDLPMDQLVPRRQREVTQKDRQRLEASLRAVGLLEPLLVYRTNGHYEILDGCLRYQILMDMGVAKVPCILGSEREAFTANRMVNRLSVFEERRMLHKALEEVDEKTIAHTFGLASIKHRLHDGLVKRLEPQIVKAFEAGKITRRCAEELGHVTPERQAEILALMDSCHDYSDTFAKGLVLKTPPAKRVNGKSALNPWNTAEQKKGELLRRLREAEQQQDFFSGLYRQYTTNLLKLVIYVRGLLANERVRNYLQEHHAQEWELFAQVINHHAD